MKHTWQWQWDTPRYSLSSSKSSATRRTVQLPGQMKREGHPCYPIFAREMHPMKPSLSHRIMAGPQE